jgi:hypothetical protein
VEVGPLMFPGLAPRFTNQFPHPFLAAPIQETSRACIILRLAPPPPDTPADAYDSWIALSKVQDIKDSLSTNLSR